MFLFLADQTNVEVRRITPQTRSVHATHAGVHPANVACWVLLLLGWHNILLPKRDFCVPFWIFVTGQTVTQSDANCKHFRLISENLISSYRCTSNSPTLSLMCESSKCWNVDWVSHKSRRNRVCTAEEALSVKRRTSYWEKKQKLMRLKVLRVSRKSCLFLLTRATGSFQMP